MRVDVKCLQCGSKIVTLISTTCYDFVDVVGLIETAAQHGAHCPAHSRRKK